VRPVTTLGFHPTWSAGREEFAYTTQNVELKPFNSVGLSDLFVVDADGGTPRKLTTGDAVLASWSPHGDRIAYSHRLGTRSQGDIWTVSPTGGDASALTTDLARDWNPV